MLTLVGAVPLEIADLRWRVKFSPERQVGRRSFSLETMARLIEPEPLLVAEPVPFHPAPVHRSQ